MSELNPWSDASKSWLDASRSLRESESRLLFGWESLADILKEPALKPLIEEHFEEIAEDKADIPLSISWPHYLDLDRRGILKIWVARGPDGEFAGYWCYYVDRHPNYAAVYAWGAPMYLAPDYRKGLNGYNFLTSSERALKALGVRRIVQHYKIGSPLSALFRRAKYRLYEERQTKVL